jgi:hypothetical protein
MAINSDNLTCKNIDAVLKFLPVFDKKGYSFSTWESGKTENGVMSLPFCNYSREVNEFVNTLYEEDSQSSHKSVNSVLQPDLL